MKTYTVTLTETEDLALSYVTPSQQAWADNAVQNRCRIAIDEIIAITVQQCLDNGIQLPVTKEEIVALAFQRRWVKSVVDQLAESESNAGTMPQ